MNDRCHCCMVDQGVKVLNKACLRGLGSLNKTNCLILSRNQKLWRAEYSANSSLPNAKYLDSAGESLLEKKARGAHEPATSCWRTAPTWDQAELMDREILAVGSWCTGVGTSERMDFGAAKAWFIQDKAWSFPFKASVKGKSKPGAPFRNLL